MTRKLVVRADDVGYTTTFDAGFKLAVEQGLVTTADVMLDSPDTVEILKWLKERPWISIGWHMHLWESPILPKEEVPSLVDEEGRFKWRHRKNELKKEATYDDAFRELSAEAERCIEIYGRAPESISGFIGGTMPIEKAAYDVCVKYGVDVNFWKDRFNMGAKDGGARGIRDYAPILNQYDLAHYKDYDPARKLLDDEWENEDEVKMLVGHPGFLDDHIEAESSCSIHRLRELSMMRDPRLVQYIRDKRIELINTRDVKYGTHEYQDHLKEINSPLWIGNM